MTRKDPITEVKVEIGKNDPVTIYKNGTDIIEAKFSDWNNKIANTVELSSKMNISFKRVFNCEAKNQLEVSIKYGNNTNNPFTQKSIKCDLGNKIQTVMIFFQKDEDYEEMECVVPDTQPEIKNGNIIIGYP